MFQQPVRRRGTCARWCCGDTDRLTLADVTGSILSPVNSDLCQFDSVAANFVLQCVPGTWTENERAFRHIAQVTANDGVFFGSTILDTGVHHTPLSRTLNSLYSGPITPFHNRGDDLDGLHTALAAAFKEAEITVAVFAARRPRRPAADAPLAAVVAGIAVYLAAFISHPPQEICRGHHRFPEDVLNQYGLVIAEQHFSRAKMPIVAAHCTLHLVSGPRTTPTVFVVDWHATGLALAGVVLAADGFWLRWRSPRRASDRGRLSPLSRWHYSSGSGLDRTNRSRRAWQGNCPGDVAAHRLDHRVLAVDACSCGWIWRRSSTRGAHRALRRRLHALPATGIAPQLPPIRPVGSRGVHGQSWRQERFWCRGQTCPPFVLHQICTPLWKPRSDSERTPETVSVRSSTRHRTRNPVRRGVHSRRLPPPHHGRTGRQTRCGGTL
ncbi:hypothetical protein [Rhodococcus opacus]|uniref:hypothetical protein n=1 Tax=Rhodococcus opacus TaxID=37919 RepID=UPI001F541D74|nr:hypothetical protein [Rhodococcus opacus]